jgi:hypothetical protein
MHRASDCSINHSFKVSFELSCIPSVFGLPFRPVRWHLERGRYNESARLASKPISEFIGHDVGTKDSAELCLSVRCADIRFLCSATTEGLAPDGQETFVSCDIRLSG